MAESLEARLALAGDLQWESLAAGQIGSHEQVSDGQGHFRHVSDILQLAGEESGLSSDLKISTQGAWLEAVAKVRTQLSRLSSDQELQASLFNVFDIASYGMSWQASGVQLEYRDDSVLSGVAAAYAPVGHQGKETIYVNSDWLASNPGGEQMERVLLEEVGHALDQRLNPQDSRGDEGRLFAKVMMGEDVSDETLVLLRQANDHGTIVIDGESVDVEFATLTTAVFVNAYRITSTVDKETNIHIFDFSNPVGAISVTDGTSSREFSGNDVSVTLQSPNVKDFYGNTVTEIHGWISRPIKVNGRVVGVYLWSDKDFASLASAQQDGNTDGDRSTADNFGYVLVVDQALFNGLSFVAGSNDTLKTIGSSSDRVDTALNSLLAPSNTPPNATNDAFQAIEAGSALAVNGGNSGVGVDPSGNVLSNDTDSDIASGDLIRVVAVGLGGTPTSIVNSSSTSSSGGTSVIGQYGSLVIGSDGSFLYTVDNSNPQVQELRVSDNTLAETFAYSIMDTASAGSTASLVITIVGSNDSPIAVNDTAVAKETEGAVTGVTATGDVLVNDSDVDGNQETKAISGLAAEALLGTVTVNPAYTELKFVGQSGFQAVSVGHTLFLNVSGTYRALYASNGSKITVAAKPVQDSTGAYLIDLSGNPAYYVDGTNQAVSSLAGATVGFKSTTQDPTNTSSMKVATVSASTAVASTSISVAQLTSGVIAKGMTMSGVNVPAGTQVIEVTYDSSNVLTGFKVNATLSSTPNNSVATFFAATGTTLTGRYGSLSLSSNGSYTYTPFSDNPDLLANTQVIDQFPYTMQDALGATANAVLSITVLGTSASDPTANPDAASVQEDGGVNNAVAGTAPVGNVLSNDTTPSGTLVLKSVSSDATAETSINQTTGIETSIAGQYGVLYVKADGAYRYVLDNTLLVVERLNSGDSLQDVFNYTTTNGAGGALSKLTLTIHGTNDFPQAVNDSAIVHANDGVTVTLSSNVITNDSDIDNLSSALSVIAINGNSSAVGNSLSGTYGALVLASGGNWTYSTDPANAAINNLLEGEFVTESFTYRIEDPLNGTGDADLVIKIYGKANTVGIADVFVNEASPFAIFPVTGASGVEVQLALGSTADPSDVDANRTGGSADIGTTLEVYLNGQWTPYTLGTFVAIPASGTLLVRVAVIQDTPYEGNEAFTLTATTRDNYAAVGVGTINDEGEGDVYLGNNQSGVPNQAGDSDPNGPDYPSALDDDRTMVVSSTVVNEASSFAFFTVTAYQGQTIELGWLDGGGTPAATGRGGDYGSNGSDGRVEMEYWNVEAVGGAAWTTYTTPVRVPGSSAATSSILVRTSIHNDQVFERAEYFRLDSAYVTGGATSAFGLGTITDDFTGSIYNSDGSLDSSSLKDDDRSISINDLNLNEASDYAIFTLTGIDGYAVDLSLLQAVGGAGKADLRSNSSLPTLEIWNGSQWTPADLTNGNTIPGAGSFKIRVSIQAEQDNNYEGAELFQLHGAYRSNSNNSSSGTATIYDDGTGIKQGPGPDDSSNNNLDDDRPAAIARNDVERSNMGGPVNIQVLNNDEGRNSQLDRDSVDLDPSSPGQQTSLVVDGEGTWTTVPSGIVRFAPLASFKSDPTSIHYTVSTRTGQVSNLASISIDVLPIAASDSVLNAVVGNSVEIDVLANDDKGDLPVAGTLRFLGQLAGVSLTVPGEGVWSISAGKVTFTPAGGFGGDPKPVRYIVNDSQNNESNAALISVDYQQANTLPFLIRVDDGNNGSFEVVIVDNTPANTFVAALGATTTHGDSDPAAGRIYYSGSTTNFMSVVIDARSKPLQTSSAPDLAVTARVQSRISSGTAQLKIEVADHDYVVNNGSSYSMVSPIGGTTHGSVTFTEKVGLSNQLLADGSAVSNNIGPLTSRSYSTSASSSFNATGSLASLFKSFLVIHPSSTRITSFNAGGKLIDWSRLYYDPTVGNGATRQDGSLTVSSGQIAASHSLVSHERAFEKRTVQPLVMPSARSGQVNRVVSLDARDLSIEPEEDKRGADLVSRLTNHECAIDCFFAQFSKNESLL